MTQVRGRRAGLVALTVVLGCAAAGCSDSGGDSDGGTTTIRFGYAGATLAPSAGLYTSLPDELGFWQDEGVAVEVTRVDGSANAITAIAGGQLDLAVVSGDPVIQAAATGTPVVIPFVLTTRNIVVTVVPEDSDVAEFVDLEGATVGVPSLSSGAVQFVQAAVSEAGGDADSVEFVAVGTGAQSASALMGGDVDAVADTDSAVPVFELAGAELRTLDTPLEEELRESVVAVTSREFLEQNPDVVAGWAKGVAQATVWADANPEEAVRLHYEVFPEEKVDGDVDELSLEQLEERLARSLPADGEDFSAFSDEEWETVLGYLVDFGLITEPIPVEDFWDTSVLDEANDFDRDDVAAVQP